MTCLVKQETATFVADQDLYVQNSGTKTFELSTGALTLTVDTCLEPDLLRIAERQNPKRAFLFVSTVLGRHIPVKPSAHRSVMRHLASQILPVLRDEPVLVMGYAETAIGIGAIIADNLRASGVDAFYLPTTRHPQANRSWFTLNEAHSHATQHHVQRPEKSHPATEAAKRGHGTLVLVDDETTTGSTFAELIEGLHSVGLRFKKILLCTLTDWADGRCIETVKKISSDAEVFAMSLLYGSWDWRANHNAPVYTLPDPVEPETPIWEPQGYDIETPRFGVAERATCVLGQAMAAGFKMPDAEERILVVGTGEYVWEPFLLAEMLDARGHDVEFIATTRSPVFVGPTVRSKYTFNDHFGIGLEMYLHNVDPSEWDRIIVMTETGRDGICPHLSRALSAKNKKLELFYIGAAGKMNRCEMN
jgi:adenine/guanine phosphoribosyltransferase-like PRPP-binding protein